MSTTDSKAQAGSIRSTKDPRKALEPLLHLRPYLLRHPGSLAAAGVALVFSALAMLSIPVAVRRMIDHGFAPGDGTLINQYFLMLIVIGGVLAIASSSRFYFVNWIGERVVADLRAEVFAHLSRLGPGFYEKTHSGEVMSRLTADTTQVKAAAGTVISQFLRNTIMLIGALVMMMVTSPSLSLLVLLAIPVIVLPLMAYGRAVRRLSRRAQDTLAEASAFAQENLSAVRTMQAFSAETSVAKHFGVAVEKSFGAARERMVARAGLTFLVILLVVVSIVGVLWYGASSVVAGTMTGGTLGQFLIYALFAAGALGELSEVWGETVQAAGAAERIAEFLAVEPDITSPAVPVPLPRPVRGELVIKDVQFRYPTRPDTPALDGLNFTIAPGEQVAVVGPSGAGKSTLFSLLLRFYDPTRGSITLDGVALPKLSLDELRASMALVPQDVAVFSGSVRDNIRYGRPDATDAEVEAAADAAQVLEIIRELPDGFDTRLGERGVLLSGGQRQRIAIARALLKDAPILLLDEATSALDAESEHSVQQALDKLMAGRTSLVIAHRLATVQNADRILVLEDGCLVETGSHRELSQRDGLYSRLSDLQFRTEAAE